MRAKELGWQLFLIVKHLAVNETEPAEKLLHIGLVAGNQGEDGCNAMVFGGFGEFLNKGSSHTLAAKNRIDADHLDPCHGSG